MSAWLEQWLDRQFSLLADILPHLIGPLILVGIAAVPTAIVYASWRSLGGGWRRQERSHCLLTVLEIGLQAGHTAEQTFLSAAARRVSELGPLFELFVAKLRSGLHLSAALDAVPRLLAPPVRAMIRVGEELGDLRRVLPACRATLKDGPGRSHSVFNNLVVLLFVSPVGPALIWFMAIRIFPKLALVAEEMTGGGRVWSFQWFAAGVLVAKAVAGLWAALWLAGWLGDPQSRPHRWLRPLVAGPVERLHFRLPWRRQRMQCDFSVMLTLLLDAGAPEERALQLAAACTANRVFVQRATRAIADLREGVKFTEAVRWLDDRGEFRWRLRNAAEPPRGFAAALAGWHETLDAKSFQQQQTISQIITTGFVLLNGAMVSLVAMGCFHLFVAIMEEAGA